jgi:uncharacterized protein with HEPN domain
MKRKVAHIIKDILETIERVQSKIGGKAFADFESDWEKRFILQRAIEIISRRLPDELKATKPEIDWRSVAGIGNVLRHEYHTISDKVIWDVAQSDLPRLKTAIEEISAMQKGNTSSSE